MLRNRSFFVKNNAFIYHEHNQCENKTTDTFHQLTNWKRPSQYIYTYQHNYDIHWASLIDTFALMMINDQWQTFIKLQSWNLCSVKIPQNKWKKSKFYDINSTFENNETLKRQNITKCQLNEKQYQHQRIIKQIKTYCSVVCFAF